MSPYSSFLFARPSFLEGVARLADLGGTLSDYNSSPTPQIADQLAARADWMAVADDLGQSYRTHRKSRPLARTAHRRLKAGRRRR